MDSKAYLIKVARIFLIVSLSVTILVAGLLTLFFGFRMGIFIVAPLIGTLMGLFAGFHLIRDLQPETFEINQQNKDSQKGLSWYEEMILEQLHAERYIEIERNGTKRIFSPPIRAQVMGGKIELDVQPYWITVTGPRGFVRILSSTLDLKKIFL